jgi:predicted MFS family arabinose efflux permease
MNSTKPLKNNATSSEKENSSSYNIKYAHKALILLALLAVLVMYIDIMLTPSLPAISKQYNVNSAQAALIISLYLVFGTAIMPIIGKIGDIYGKKRTLMYVLIAYLVMVSITSFMSRFDIILISRTFQGIGLSMFPLAFSLIREEFPKEMVPRAQGLIAGMFGGGTALGLPLGAYISNSYGWQANYHVVLPFLIVLTILIFIVIRESRYKQASVKLDYIGAAWLGISLAMIVLGLSQGATWGWTSIKVLALTLIGGLSLILLLIFEKRSSHPLLDFKMLSKRNIMIANISILILSMSMFLAFQTIAYRMEEPLPSGFGFDILTTGLYLLPMAVTMMILAYPVGILVSKYGVKKFLIGGALIGAVGFLLLSTASSAAQIAEYIVIAAVGLAILMISLQNLLVLTADPHEMGLATSMNTTFRNLGSSLGAPIAGSFISTYTVLYTVGSKSFSLPAGSAYTYPFYVASAGFIVAFFLVIFAREVINKKTA